MDNKERKKELSKLRKQYTYFLNKAGEYSAKSLSAGQKAKNIEKRIRELENQNG